MYAVMHQEDKHFDKDLIKKNLLDQKEIDWVNNYHSKVYTCMYTGLVIIVFV